MSCMHPPCFRAARRGRGGCPAHCLFFPPLTHVPYDRLFVLYVNMANYYPLTPELRASLRPVTECFNASTSPVNTDHRASEYHPHRVLPSFIRTSRPHGTSPILIIILLYASTSFRDHPTAFLVNLCTPFPDDRPTLSVHRQPTRCFDSGKGVHEDLGSVSTHTTTLRPTREDNKCTTHEQEVN
jgi:hypothetical protein